MIWQTAFDNLQKEEHSLCELLIIRSLIDLIEYDTKNEKWGEFITKNDQFKVGLDFIAAKLGYYSWRQIFYSEKFVPKFDEDKAISKILHDFRDNKRKKNKIPKSTVFFSKTNDQLRQKIIKDCLTRKILERVMIGCKIFNISQDGKYLTIESKTIDSFGPTHQIDSIIVKSFPDPLPSFISTKERTIQKLSKTDFDRIKEIQGHVCFFCKTKPIKIQDHYIPDHFVHETKQYNIVGACNECNRKKWDIEPPNREDFDIILKRNKEDLKLKEPYYYEKNYIREFKRFEKITSGK
ncbi:HNH endonuclease [Nitrosopumilus sp.]|uniref:HNH endonuclease n=1 Tax=Nitrosopumilus sp. TaxID=2024843 RepID=UPI0034A084E0